jgi:hypothetical protein
VKPGRDVYGLGAQVAKNLPSKHEALSVELPVPSIEEREKETERGREREREREREQSYIVV